MRADTNFAIFASGTNFTNFGAFHLSSYGHDFMISMIFVTSIRNNIFAFDKGERIPNLVLGVLCHTARKNRDFLCNGSSLMPI